jgi:hypothetical protein
LSGRVTVDELFLAASHALSHFVFWAHLHGRDANS